MTDTDTLPHGGSSCLARGARETRLGQRGVTVWLTGLSGSGKTTVARLVERILVERGRVVVVLDGDEVRRGLCSDLGFSPSGRRENIRRVGQVASLITPSGVVVICAFISPYTADRRGVRELMAAPQDFIEVYTSAPLGVCEARDRKGLYERARAGEIEDFTGISAPYEAPLQPELVLSTDRQTPYESALAVVRYLEAHAYIAASPDTPDPVTSRRLGIAYVMYEHLLRRNFEQASALFDAPLRSAASADALETLMFDIRAEVGAFEGFVGHAVGELGGMPTAIIKARFLRSEVWLRLAFTDGDVVVGLRLRGPT